MAVGANQRIRGTTFWCHPVHLKTITLDAGDRGSQGITFLRRFFDAVEPPPQRFGEELEGGIASGTQVIETALRLAGVGDLAGATRRTLHHQRLRHHLQLTSIVRHTIKTPSVTPPPSQSPLTRGIDAMLRTQTVFSLPEENGAGGRA
jgi:hypothetical protein